MAHTDEGGDGESDSLRVVVAALTGNVLIAVSKFVAAFFSGSVATLAEAVHSVADCVNQVLLMVGMRRARRPPTILHPFGHAAESYFWPFMVSIERKISAFAVTPATAAAAAVWSQAWLKLMPLALLEAKVWS